MNESVNELVFLPFDSALFGYGIGRISAHQLLPHQLQSQLLRAFEEKIELIYLACEQDDFLSQSTIKKGEGYLKARLIDEKTTFLQSLKKQQQPNLNLDLSASFSSPKKVSEQLYSLALQSGMYSRFKVDEHFQNGEFEKLYRLWIENSVQGDLAKKVVVYQEDDKELGLLTLGIKNIQIDTRVDIGLIAVDKSARGRSIGKLLIQQAKELTLAWGFDQLQVVTQKANEGACRFYEANGFEVERVDHIYHLWLRDLDSIL